MPNLDIAHRRLVNQQIARPVTDNPAGVVKHLGAVQSQDFRAAMWALGLRVKNSTEAGIEQALSDGAILRTHVLRPTWHYVTPEDIRWMLALTGPRVEASAAGYYRQLHLDEDIFKKTNQLIEKSLQGGQQLTKAELGKVFMEAGLDVNNLLRLSYIIFHAELIGLVCNGARRGNNITFTLLDESVPPSRPLQREEAVVELVRRFFTGHGPATIPDFVWWSGLTAADARFGLNLLSDELAQDTIDGQAYWFAAGSAERFDLSDTLFLLPNYDEYVVSYKDRKAIEDTSLNPNLDARGNYLFNHLIVSNGVVIGTWKRTFTPKKVDMTFVPFRPLTNTETERLNLEAGRFGRFAGLPVTLEPGKAVAEQEK